MASTHLGAHQSNDDVAEFPLVGQGIDTAHQERVLAARFVIEQAKGMVMLAHACDETAAFDLLIAVSQNANVKLRDLAVDFVADIGAHGVDRRYARAVTEALARASRR